MLIGSGFIFLQQNKLNEELYSWRLWREELDWERLVGTNFTHLASEEDNPWLNNCDKARSQHKGMYEFTRSMTNRLVVSNFRLSREEMLVKAGVWTEHECPSVVDFYSHSGAFDLYPEERGIRELYPIMTTSYAVRSTCQLKITERIIVGLNSSMAIVAGTHIGAVRHGGIIPWDDDIDAWIPGEMEEKFLKACGEYKLKGAEVRCWKYWNAIKLYVVDNVTEVDTGLPFKSPYVDIFLYGKDMEEVFPDGKVRDNNLVPVRHPLRQWFLGGEVFTGPPRINSIVKHDLSVCVMSDWNHRFEKYTRGRHVDCCVLREHFPFSYLVNVTHGGKEKKLEQILFRGKVLATTVLDMEGIVERMYRVGRGGKLERVKVPEILQYDP